MPTSTTKTLAKIIHIQQKQKNTQILNLHFDNKIQQMQQINYLTASVPERAKLQFTNSTKKKQKRLAQDNPTEA